MALVKVVSNNLFSGANLQKLAVGSQVNVDNSTAEKWEKSGLVEVLEKQTFEVATPEKDADAQPEQPEQPANQKKAK
ncbi:hypothetical protein [Hafnia paralvei]|uniref:hypothetical protein n=1 Tax=Hafnia paralvei TaxID=546367 RepID=UPI0010340C3A|nr:hypothetical protein [Hafnia paralvei]TBM29762.1 hypothetical protein EYY85_06330 [Hafnia paralvei]